MHYSYNQSNLPANAHNRITNSTQLLKCLHGSLYMHLLVNVIFRVNTNQSSSFWEDIPQVCIKPSVHTNINDCVKIKM